MFQTKWKEIHFTNITAESYSKLNLPEGFIVKFYGYDELVELLQYYNEYHCDYFIDKYAIPLMIASNTKKVLALEKNMFEENSETNFNGERKVPAQSQIVSNNRNLIKNYFSLVQLMTGDPIFLTSSFLFGEQLDIRMKFSGVGTLSHIKEWVDSDISNIKSHITHIINKINIPFEQDYIELARRSLELTYRSDYPGVNFTMLMTALEVLVSNSNNIGMSLRAYVPKFYNHSFDEKKKIREEIRTLYKIRCKIVHEGQYHAAKFSDIEKLRKHIRKIILILNELNLPKSSIKKILKKNEDELLIKTNLKFDFI